MLAPKHQNEPEKMELNSLHFYCEKEEPSVLPTYSSYNSKHKNFLIEGRMTRQNSRLRQTLQLTKVRMAQPVMPCSPLLIRFFDFLRCWKNGKRHMRRRSTKVEKEQSTNLSTPSNHLPCHQVLHKTSKRIKQDDQFWIKELPNRKSVLGNVRNIEKIR